MKNQRAIAAQTNRGNVRTRNEDMFAIGRALYGGNMNEPLVIASSSDVEVVMVADGMGGHASGELASRFALESLISNFRAFCSVEACTDALVRTNDHIYEQMKLHPASIGMGTTVVGAASSSDCVIYFNVGDSRLYRHVPGRLLRLSHDDVPPIAGTSARRLSHAITQSLGGHRSQTSVLPHVGVDSPLISGEGLLLCSDGLTDMVGEEMILDALESNAHPGLCVGRLVDMALESGGTDNVTVVMLRMTNSEGGAQ